MPALLTPDQRAECIRLREAGHSRAALAERYGLTAKQIKTLLTNSRRRAIDKAPAVPVKCRRRDEVLELLRAGYSANKIRGKLRMDWRTVQALAREWQEMRGAEEETVAKLEAELCAGDAQTVGAVEADLPPPPAPVDPFIASLMARGLSREAAARSAALYRVRRSVHAWQHEAFAP